MGATRSISSSTARRGRTGCVTALRLVPSIPAWLLHAYVFGQVLGVVAVLSWFVAIVIGRCQGDARLSAYCLRYRRKRSRT